RVDDECRKREREQSRKALLFKDLKQLMAETAAAREGEPTLPRRFEALVEQSGLDLSPRELLINAGTTGLCLGALGGLLRQSVLDGLPMALIGAAIPLLYVQLKRKARLEKLLSQLPDA